MRISELIQELEETMDVYGDLPVIVKDTAEIKESSGRIAFDEHLAEVYNAQVISRMYDRYLELKR